jgi:hypothetical protein
MTPLPIHRWKSFWFGILVMGFLTWAWYLSPLKGLDVRWSRATSDYGVQNLWGSIGFYIGDYRTGSWDLPAPGLHVWVRPNSLTPPGKFRWEPAMTTDGQDPDNPRTIRVRIAHWLVILCFLVPWAAFLAWRVRKQRTLTKSPV